MATLLPPHGHFRRYQRAGQDLPPQTVRRTFILGRLPRLSRCAHSNGAATSDVLQRLSQVDTRRGPKTKLTADEDKVARQETRSSERFEAVGLTALGATATLARDRDPPVGREASAGVSYSKISRRRTHLPQESCYHVCYVKKNAPFTPWSDK
jgi:hypothetical protein